MKYTALKRLFAHSHISVNQHHCTNLEKSVVVLHIHVIIAHLMVSSTSIGIAYSIIIFIMCQHLEDIGLTLSSLEAFS